MALYNSTLRQFFGSCDRDVRVWDAVNRQQLQVLHDQGSAGISCLCFDDRQRKFVVGDQEGGVFVNNAINGVTMKTCERHLEEVSAVVYCEADRLIVSVSWDRCIHVYDERDPGCAPLLRLVYNAHAADIRSLAFSYDLSLLVTSGDDRCVNVWDFQVCRASGKQE